MGRDEALDYKKRAGQVLAGAGAGVIAKSATAPLERIKILMQIQAMATHAPTDGNPNVLYRSVPQALVKIVKDEGVLALYKGNFANCVRVIPNYALKFGCNDAYKDLVCTPGQTHADLTFPQLVAVGSLAGVTQICGSYPLETIRTRISLSAGFGIQYNGIVDCARRTVQTEGFSALYKGIGPTFLSGAPYVGLQMASFEVIKRSLPTEHDGTINPGYKMIGGAAAGLFSQMITYPGDTIRRRMQTNGMGGAARVYQNSWHCMKMVLAREGFKGFYLGATANAIRCLPGAGIQFAAYDILKDFFCAKSAAF